METLTWSELRSLQGAAFKAGSASGIYLMGRRDEVSGIPVSYEWVYVGQGKNLQRRLLQHLPVNETNLPLKEWTKRVDGDLVVRFALVPAARLDLTERMLVRALTPKHNRIMYRMEKKNGHIRN